MVGVVSPIPSGDNFTFADFGTPRCQFCTKMSDLCYLGKTGITLQVYGSVCLGVRLYVSSAQTVL